MSRAIDDILESAVAEVRKEIENFKARATANALPGTAPAPVSPAHAAKFSRAAVEARREALVEAFSAEVSDAVTVRAGKKG